MFIYICDAPAATLLEDQYGWVAVVWCVHAVGAEPMPGNPSDTAGHIEVCACSWPLFHTLFGMLAGLGHAAARLRMAR